MMLGCGRKEKDTGLPYLCLSREESEHRPNDFKKGREGGGGGDELEQKVGNLGKGDQSGVSEGKHLNALSGSL